MQMQYAATIAVVLLVGVIVYFGYRSRKGQPAEPKRTTASNVISMDRHRKAKQSAVEQPCSSCKKKNGKLIFYAQDNGTVVGLCKDCKAKAKKRDMLPL
ncbi:hypothetical protein [Paenibacillus graminis]|uniref:Uncharacterized protein n=2 Tax=Paenibacillus graminis TaxID=189425 RepID=A0A089M6P1_9BACL|nr:hypothetical protein [Paenibacillus graminis]AIQ69451.1 hypothetical protein PGRAT_18750 [Paenibacillus graminis]MEC0167835.1 hypothetical protein [Paenibacillus graminis]